MNDFSYENQGTNTYLVYQVGEDEALDTMGLGMITNNHIPGLAQTMCLQMNSSKYIKYNVSAKISVRQFFSGAVNKARLLGVFNGIVNAMLAAEDYMIDPDMILLDLDYIYADVSTCETILVCLPILDLEKQHTDLGVFFKNIMFSTQFDQTENCDYVAKIMNHLNSTPVFSLVDFKNMLDSIFSGNNGAVPNKPAASASVPVSNKPQAQVLTHAQKPMAPVSAQPATPVAQQPVKPVAQQPVKPVGTQTPVQPVKPVKVSTQQAGMNVPNAMQPAGAATSGELPEKEMTKMYLLQHYSKENKAIYDAQQAAKKNGSAAQTQTPVAPVTPDSGSNASASSEKPMSMMYLLQHYSKENKAIYDAQQAAKKNGGAAQTQTPVAPAKPQTGATQNASFAVPGGAPSNGGFAIPGQTPAVSQPSAPINTQSPVSPIKFATPASAPQQPVKPVTPVVQAPVQTHIPETPSGVAMNFGDTTVLSGGMIGETTVLNGGMQNNQVIAPHLVRAKNNEKIPVNKPVFRIGKEKSYVDYFIGDNSAISRSHANIITRDGKYYVMDTNSTNHTFLDGSILKSNSEYEIVHGSKLRFANEDFDFLLY